MAELEQIQKEKREKEDIIAEMLKELELTGVIVERIEITRGGALIKGAVQSVKIVAVV